MNNSKIEGFLAGTNYTGAKHLFQELTKLRVAEQQYSLFKCRTIHLNQLDEAVAQRDFQCGDFNGCHPVNNQAQISTIICVCQKTRNYPN